MATTYYATTRFKKVVDEHGIVREWIEPGDKIARSDLKDVSEEEWQSIIDNGSVTDKEYTPDSAVPGAIPGTIDTSPPAATYSDMGVDDLKAEAKIRDIGGYSSMNKEDLVSALEKADKASTGTPE